MKRAIIAASAVVLTAGLVTASPAEAKPGPAVPKGQTTKLTKAVQVNGILKHLRQFQRIANANDGNRASGLPGYEASVDYVTQQLRKSGYTVKKQAFTFPFWQDLSPATLTVDGSTVETASFTYSGDGSITGPIVPANVTLPPTAPPGETESGCAVSDFQPAPAEPAIALVQRGTCPFGDKVDNAVAAGYDAVLIFNEGQEGRTSLVAGTLGEPKSVPVAGLSYEDGAALATAENPTGTLTTDTEFDPEATTWNVIADLPKKRLKKIKHKDQVVVVGAHLDSVAEGPGINDNGTGSAGILEIAKQLRKTKLDRKLQRPVRFAFWGAEEAGLLGSEHYVANLSERQLSKIYANLNFDMIGSPNYARFVYDGDGSDGDAGPAGSGAIEKVFTGYFDSKGLASEPTAFDGRSDYGPFIAAGIPAGGLFTGAEGVKTPEQVPLYGGTAGVAYDECYHSECDDITNVNVDALHEMGDAAAFAVATLGLSKRGLYPDGSRKAAKKGKATGQAHTKVHSHAPVR
ncbi:aminopeptidase [Aeromicrobium flavum]|uniref:Aminopeptidase n=1 Tax=Aeromicrobium flavum TaxID=416568 RepID=A0A512HUL6_9ACTN|nr:M20/M25/M40 family metallo-hydrolase [Aeromicrobium flavum]GEO89146.1 aminopeptidase [Aeromicrobium flavum]